MWFRERPRGSVLLDVRDGPASGVRLLRGGAAARRPLLPRLWDPGRGNGPGPYRGTTRRERVVRRRDRVDHAGRTAGPRAASRRHGHLLRRHARGDRGRGRHGGEVHRRRRDGGVRRAVGPRGRPGAGTPGRDPHAATARGGQHRTRRHAWAHAADADRRQHRRGAGGRGCGLRRADGDRRRRQHRGQAADHRRTRGDPGRRPDRAARFADSGSASVATSPCKGKSESVVASAVLGGSGEAADVGLSGADGGPRRRARTAPLACTSARPPKAGRTSSRSTATRGSARAG